MRHIEFLIDTKFSGERLDVFLSSNLSPNISRNMIQSMLLDGSILVDGISVKKGYKIVGNENVVVNIMEAKPIEANAEDIPLNICYEDSDIIVLDKQRGMVVHPSIGHTDGTMVNALLHHCSGSLSGINGLLRPGIVHRLDKDTSGLILVAKNDASHKNIAAQIKAREILKVYRGIIVGRLKEAEGTINEPIGRDEKFRKRMSINYKNGKDSITHYRVLEEYNNHSYVEFIIETGRTHQIRVHMAHLGKPLLGDELYGAKPFRGFFGQCLHSYRVKFNHPTNFNEMEFICELPEYFSSLLYKVGR